MKWVWGERNRVTVAELSPCLKNLTLTGESSGFIFKDTCAFENCSSSAQSPERSILRVVMKMYHHAPKRVNSSTFLGQQKTYSRRAPTKPDQARRGGQMSWSPGLDERSRFNTQIENYGTATRSEPLPLPMLCYWHSPRALRFTNLLFMYYLFMYVFMCGFVRSLLGLVPRFQDRYEQSHK